MTTTRACQDTLNDPSSYSTDTEATSSTDKWTDASGKTTQVGSFKTNHNIKRRNKLSMNKKFKAVFKGFGHDLYRTPEDALDLSIYEKASSKVNRPILDFTSKIMDTVRKVKMLNVSMKSRSWKNMLRIFVIILKIRKIMMVNPLL